MKKNIGTLTCPECGNKQQIEIPDTSCIPFYKCKGCNNIIQAKKSCCVFCDYGNKQCPVAAEHKT